MLDRFIYKAQRAGYGNRNLIATHQNILRGDRVHATWISRSIHAFLLKSQNRCLKEAAVNPFAWQRLSNMRSCLVICSLCPSFFSAKMLGY
jgi:hypothetical protein